MKSENSQQHSQKSAPESFPETDQSSPRPFNLFL